MTARDLALRAVAVGLTVAASPFVLYGRRHSADQFAVLLAVFVGAVSVGGLFGFLFGLPKSGVVARHDDAASYAASTNLEQISDWATKLLLGATLAGAGGLVRGVDGFLVDRAAPAMGGRSAYPMALFAVVFGTSLGTIGGWLATRLALAGAMARSDLSMRESLERLAEKAGDPLVSEQLLLIADEVPDTPSHQPSLAQQFETRIHDALVPAVQRIGATLEPEPRIFDDVVTRGDIHIGVECKHVLRELTLNHLRFQRARFDRPNPVQAIVLVTDGPVARAVSNESRRLRADQGLGIFILSTIGIENLEDKLVEILQEAIAFTDPPETS